MRFARLLVLLLVAAGPGCRSAATAPPTLSPNAASGAIGVDAPAVALPLNVRWVRDSAEYRAIVAQTYRAATRLIERAAPGRTAGSWAVVLDADETVISNLAYQEERARAGLPFTPESWSAWVHQKQATALPGAHDFLSRVRELGGHIAIVTNRRASECDDTIAVFKTEDLAYDVILCRPDDGPSDKNARFEAVASGTAVAAPAPVDVVAFLGDNILDFPALSQSAVLPDSPVLARFGERFFVFPNPMYGSWER